MEFMPPGSFEPLTDMVGGGPHGLEAGYWTDDTSMALCLAESLIERRTFDPTDQLERYVRWYREGHLSSTGECFDIGNTTVAALRRFEETGEPYCGTTNPHSAGNGSIMRLAPIPLFFAPRPWEAIEISAESSRTTHGAPNCVDACRYLGALLVGAIRGAGKEELLSELYCPVPGCWDEHPLAPEIDEVARGSFKRREPPKVKGSSYVVRSLEAALWAFHKGDCFEEGCLLAANRGDDADTTAAVYGQLAGAFYGERDIPDRWLSKLAHRSLVEDYAQRLFERREEGYPVELRDAQPSDIRAIQGVARITWHHTYRDTIPERVRTEFLDRAYSEGSLRRRIESNVFFVALHDGSIVGFADFRPLSEGRVELAAIYVLPEMQGGGIGTDLLRAGIARFPGETRFVLRVERDNAAARRFYETNGFRRLGEFTEELFGHRFQDVEMILDPES